MDDFEIVGPGFVVSGENEEAMIRAAAGIRQQIAFYGSTPAYRGVLELHGWGDAQDELNRMSKEGAWQAMADLIDEEMLSTFAVVGEPDSVASEIAERYGDCVDRMTFYVLGGDTEVWDGIAADLSTV